MQNLGAQIFFVEGGYAEAERAAGNMHKQTIKYLSHRIMMAEVIAGQGTIGLEILRESILYISPAILSK